jgi:hypothetical protein
VVCESLKQAHYSRNQYQDNNITNNPNEIIGSEDWEAQPPEANMYHMHTAGEQGQDAKDNVKYMSDNGKYEVVINFTDKDNPKIVTDPYNKGTYNFADYREYPLEHIVIDVIPYYLWGNSKEDSNPFFMIHRIFGNLGG